jgi:pimeloyl-ACP methyl ester carboxylesterase
MWFPFLPELARQHTVVAIDLPGFGHSSSGPFHSRDPEAALRFFVDPVESLLRDDPSLQGAAIVGHSLGGFVALELALRGALEPRKLVLLGSMGLGPHATLAARLLFHASPERLARRLGSTLFSQISTLPDTPLGRRLMLLEHELMSADGGKDGAATAFEALCPLRGPLLDRQERLGEIRARTLIVWGEQDQVFPAPVAIDAAARIPRARLIVEPLGHSPHLEAPERILPELMRFLED